MQDKRILTRGFCVCCSLALFYISSKMIIDVKATEFRNVNNLITTAYNNNIIDSVKFSNNSYRLFLNDEDIKNVKYDKQELSHENIKLLNRMSFQDIPGSTKEFIMSNTKNLVDYSYAGDDLYYFKMNNDISVVGANDANHSNEMEFKVSGTFTNAELKAIKKDIKKNQRKY